MRLAAKIAIGVTVSVVVLATAAGVYLYSHYCGGYHNPLC